MVRRKTLFAVTATSLGLVALIYILSQVILVRGYLDSEDAIVQRNVERAVNALDDTRLDLLATVKDWAYWDDTYRFIQDGNEAYRDANLMDDSFVQFRVNVVMFINRDGDVIFSDTFDLDEIAAAPLLAALENRLQTGNDPLFAYARLRAEDPVDTAGISGIVLAPEGALLVAAVPILTSWEEGPAQGMMLWGRYLGETELSRLASLTRLSLQAYPLNRADLPQDIQRLRALLTPESTITVQPLNDEEVAGYALVNDVYGNPALVLRVDQARDIVMRGQATIAYFALALVISGLVFGGIMLLMMEHLILRRLARTSRSVRHIGQSSDFSVRVAVEGSDELTDLGNAINAALDAQAQAQQALQQLNAELERRVAERTGALESQSNYLRTILDMMEEGVIYGTDEEIFYANRKLLAMSGYSADELIGKPRTLLFDGSPLAEKRLPSSLQERAASAEWTLRHKDGTTMFVAVTSTHAVELNGKTGSLYLVRDITEEKALQERKERFLANASHELRTPLANLMTRLWLLRKQPQDLETHLQVLDQVSLNMKSLVEDLLDVSRFKRGIISLHREKLALQTLIGDVIALQRQEAERKDITLTAVLPEQLLYAFLDPKRFSQVLVNLVVNAITYTPIGGRVTVELKTEAQDDLTYALIEVADTGIGIDDQHLDQIFQPFFRASQELPGTGLGLTIVKEIVEQHGGEIAVASQPGKGSTFRVKIIVVNEDAREQQPT